MTYWQKEESKISGVASPWHNPKRKTHITTKAVIAWKKTTKNTIYFNITYKRPNTEFILII